MEQKQIKLSCTILNVQESSTGISFETDARFHGFDKNGEAVEDKTNFIWSCHRISREFAKVSPTFARLFGRTKAVEESAAFVEYIDFCLKGAEVEIIRMFQPAGTYGVIDHDSWSTTLAGFSNEKEMLANILNPIFEDRIKDFKEAFAAIDKAAKASAGTLDLTNV